MYTDYWNLTDRPFDNTVDERFFFYSQSHEEALVRLLYTISENKGLMVLTGAPGTGKTLLCEIVRRQLATKGYHVSMQVNPNLPPVDFLRGMLRGLGVHRADLSKAELLWEVEDFSRDALRRNAECIHIIDEAQSIEDPATLEEIRLLANLQHNSRYLITTFLVGGEALVERIGQSPDLQERIAVVFKLEPLTEEETGKYVHHRISVAGGQHLMFSDEALKEIYNCTEGIPRRINNICDAALLMGSGTAATNIDANIIHEATADAKLLG